jgi:1-acyl-sn-glycerol-3-phosphate acyltransferase
MAGITLGFSLRTAGQRHIPSRGPALFIANHQSYLDPFLVNLATRQGLCYLARKTLFRNPILTWYMRTMNAVAIDQEGIGIEGLRTAVKLLKEGHRVAVFPEGTRTPDGLLQPLRPGIHLLIHRAQPPVVPVGIAGAYDAWPIWRPYPIPAPLFLPAGKGTIAAYVGRPIPHERLQGLEREELLTVLFDELKRVHNLAEGLRRKR